MGTYTSSPRSLEARPGAELAGLAGLPAGAPGPPAGLEGLAAGAPVGRGGLAAALDWLDAAVTNLASIDPAQEFDAALATGMLAAERLGDRYEAVRLRLLAAVDARGAAGAEQGVYVPTAAWLRATCRMSPALATQRVRSARALHRGPLAGTARALAAGEVSYQHAAALGDATHDLPPGNVREAEPELVDAAQQLDPPRLRRLTTHLRDVIDPDAADERGRARLEKRGLWLSATLDGVDIRGLLDPEAGEAVKSALSPLARPTGPDDRRSAAQRRADGLGELGRRALRAGDLPQEGGLRPNVNVTVELDSLRTPHGVGGVGGCGGVLSGEAARRLSCDAVVTRAIVRRHPHAGHDGAAGATGHDGDPGHATGGDHGGEGGLVAKVRAAIPLLPPQLGAPVEVLDYGRATRTVRPGLRHALDLRDGGCIAPGCDRPPQLTDAHHVRHWVDGGPTSLENLVLLCRTHHVAVHEGGWRLHRDPATGGFTLTPPARRGHPHGHDPPAA